MNQGFLQDQVALIIGAGRSPAPALAMGFSAQGAIIAANDLSPVLLDPLKMAIADHGGRIQTYVADATRGMPLRAMLDEILEDFGRVDILVNNQRVLPEAPLLVMDEWDWQRTIEMNLNGPFLVTQLVAKLMKEQGRGTILNLVDTDMDVLEAPGRAAYAASQQGMLALSLAAARELIAYNIHVHTLCPEETLLHAEKRLNDRSRTSGAQKISTPSQPPITGGTLSELAIFLCSPEAAQLAGQVYHVSYNAQGDTPQ
jgi:NAD(P)-dependent dehydrogenase (short-subunit alcohol dehydrogenase family)